MMEEKLKEEMSPKPQKGGAGVRVRKVFALILLFVFSLVFTLGGIGTAAVFVAGATLEEALDGTEYYGLGRSQRYAQDVAYNLIAEDIAQDSIWLDGEYDGNQTVDITNLSGGILVTNKNPATTYKLKDLVTMYENSVDGELEAVIEASEYQGEAEIIEYLHMNYEADAFMVDNLGNLYFVVSEADSWAMDVYVNALLTGGIDEVNPMEEFGCVIYALNGDDVNLCMSLPEGFEYVEEVGWTEFSARHMIDISGLTEREQTDFNYGDYGVQFQYLYKHGMQAETLLPESGEKLALYALKNPATVSIYDLYKQLASAIEEVGSAVANKEFENIVSANDNGMPAVYYWVKDLSSDSIWTNNPRWDGTDVKEVQSEIINFSDVNQNGLYYPYYIGVEYHNTSSDFRSEELFASNVKTAYSDSPQMLLCEEYGMSDVQYVIAVNPLAVAGEDVYEMGYSYYVNFYSYQNVYTLHAPYIELNLLMTIIGGVGAIICAVISVVMAGRRDKTKNRYAAPFARNCPIELMLLLFVGCWIGYAVYFMLYFYDGFLGWNYGTTFSDYVGIIIAVMGFVALATWQILALVTKGKSKNMGRNSLIGRAGSGLKKSTEVSGFTKKCPIEVMLALFLVIWIVFGEIMYNVNYSSSGLGFLIGVIVLFAGIAILAYWQIGTLVNKAKTKNMTTNSLVKRFGGAVVGGCKNAYKNRKVTGKLLILSILFCVVNLIFIGLSHATYITPVWIFLLIVLWIVTIALLMKKCIQKQRLKDGIHEIAGGNMDYQIQMDKLSGDELDMAWDLNNIQSGMENAVERMMKSERMKTDLITNVSHDLKTPLTSIINYVDILKKEDIQDPKIRGYIDILEQKSLRLKNLTEDLMEAAKISSGNITLELQNINLKQLLYQTNGEFEEKFAKRNLQLVCTLPDSDVYINADGRRMWRVIENLYNNAAKYAQPYSRVYVDGKLQAGKVELVIKNVSEAPLNISADELMERFVRGDVARNTEGSGLGLEIARNLTVMQKGTFDIQLDGDLFKVVLTFDAV